MDLSESKFYYAGDDMDFAVFSDYPCRVRYLESIPVPISQVPVEVYTIEPGGDSQWIVIQQRNDGKSSLKFFVREREAFRENQLQDLPKHLKEHILQQAVQLTRNREHRRVA